MPLHVVTVQMRYAECPGCAGGPLLCLLEIFRGEEAECRRVKNAIAGAYDDRRRIDATTVHMALLSDWEEFLANP